MDSLPKDIRNLPKYFVSSQLFVCTTIILILLLIISIIAVIHRSYRVKKRLINPQHIANYNITLQIQGTKKTIPAKPSDQQLDLKQENQSQSSNQNKQQKQFQSMESNRLESRFLQFICLIAVIAININAFTALIMEVIAFVCAIVMFLVFNVFRIGQSFAFLRALFLIPLVAAYLPFYIFSKSILEVQRT